MYFCVRTSKCSGQCITGRDKALMANFWGQGVAEAMSVHGTWHSWRSAEDKALLARFVPVCRSAQDKALPLRSRRCSRAPHTPSGRPRDTFQTKRQLSDQAITFKPSDNFQTKRDNFQTTRQPSREVTNFTRGDTGHEEQEGHAGYGPRLMCTGRVLPVTPSAYARPEVMVGLTSLVRVSSSTPELKRGKRKSQFHKFTGY